MFSTVGALLLLPPAWLVGTHLAMGSPANESLIAHGVAPLISDISAYSLSTLFVLLLGVSAWLRRAEFGHGSDASSPAKNLLIMSNALLIGAVTLACGSLAIMLTAARIGGERELYGSAAMMFTYGLAALLGSPWAARVGQQKAAIAAGSVLVLIGAAQIVQVTRPSLAGVILPHWAVGLAGLSWFAMAFGAIYQHVFRWASKLQTSPPAEPDEVAEPAEVATVGPHALAWLNRHDLPVNMLGASLLLDIARLASLLAALVIYVQGSPGALANPLETPLLLSAVAWWSAAVVWAGAMWLNSRHHAHLASNPLLEAPRASLQWYPETQLLSVPAVLFTAAVVVQAYGAWDHLADGRIFHWLVLSIVAWCGVFTAIDRRLGWVGGEAAIDAKRGWSIAPALLITMGALACLHASVVAFSRWQLDIGGSARTPLASTGTSIGSEWHLLPALAIASLASMIGLVLWRAWVRPTELRLEACALLGAVLVTRWSVVAEPPTSTALSSCWSLAGYGLFIACIVSFRGALLDGWSRLSGRSLLSTLSATRVALSAMLAAYLVVTAITIYTLRTDGPVTVNSFGGVVQHLGPLLALAGALVWQTRSLGVPAFGVWGGLTACLASTLLVIHTSWSPLTAEVFFARLVACNGVAAATWAWLWLGATQPLEPAAVERMEDRVWRNWVLLACLLPVVSAAWIVGSIVIWPDVTARAMPELISRWSWLAWLLAASVAWCGFRHRPRELGWLGAAAGAVLCSLVVGHIDTIDTRVRWWGYHSLLAAAAALAAALTTVEIIAARRGASGEGHEDGPTNDQPMSPMSSPWRSLGDAALIIVLPTYLLTWRAALFDPTGPWWSFGVCLSLAFVPIALAFRSQRRAMPLAASMLCATAIGFYQSGLTWQASRMFWPLLALQCCALGWCALCRLRSENRLSLANGDRLASSRFHWHVAIWGSLTGILGGMALILVGSIGRLSTPFISMASTAATLQCIVAAACLWDLRFTRTTWPLFMALVSLVLHAVLWLPGDAMLRAVLIGLAALFMMAATIWRRGPAWDRLLTRFHSPPPDRPLDQAMPALAWLEPTIVAGITLLTLPVLASALGPEESRGFRYALALVPIFGAIAVAQLTDYTESQERRRASLGNSPVKPARHHLSLALAGMGVVLVSWSDISPETQHPWLERFLRALTMTSIYAVGVGILARRQQLFPPWAAAFQRASVASLGIAVSLFLGLLSIEWANFEAGSGAPLTVLQTITVAVFVGALAASLIVFAVSPRHDPLQLTDDARVAYTFGSQALLGLIVLHLYLCMPSLFRWNVGWPYVVMGLAFGGAALGHWLSRTGYSVLGRPTTQVAMLLPLAPLLGMLVTPTSASYAIVSGAAAVLFGAAALRGGSWRCAFVSLFLGNVTLWSFYREVDFASLVSNPQAWLIPPAVSTLAAAQAYRQQLSRTALASLRYIAAGVIYISSTSELFIQGLGETLWPPMVLAFLSVVGVLAGIFLRIRAFLYFGATFLLMAMIAMVSHAGRAFNHVWPWWAFGITLGVLILLAFGMFEKWRDESRDMLRKMKDWDA